MVEEYNTNGKFKEEGVYDYCNNLLKLPKSDYKEIFTILEKNNNKDFWKILDNAIRSIPETEPLGLSHILAYLNPVLIITTNWDRLLDGLRGYEILNWKDHFREDEIEKHQYIPIEDRFENGYSTIMFLHGHISRLDTVLITHQQYQKLYLTENDYSYASTTIDQPQEFKQSFKYKPNFDKIFRDSDTEILFFGMDPKNREFKGLVKSLFGGSDQDIFIISSTDTTDISNDISQNITVLEYPKGRHDLALDFLVRLEPRKSNYSDNYKVFSTFDRKKYLCAQKKLEEQSSSIKYCTPRFTNVFGDDDYIRNASNNFVDTVYQELGQHGDIDVVNLSKTKFTEEVLEGMIERRENIRSKIEKKEIKSIYVLFTGEPKTEKERIEDQERINDTIKRCKIGKVNLQIRQINLKKYPNLNKDKEPFKDPSMALIIGNSDANFNVGFCHASQATISDQLNSANQEKSYVRFQWVHTDTIFAQNRLAWFDRAWELAEEYIV